MLAVLVSFLMFYLVNGGLLLGQSPLKVIDGNLWLVGEKGNVGIVKPNLSNGQKHFKIISNSPGESTNSLELDNFDNPKPSEILADLEENLKQVNKINNNVLEENNQALERVMGNSIAPNNDLWNKNTKPQVVIPQLQSNQLDYLKPNLLGLNTQGLNPSINDLANSQVQNVYNNWNKQQLALMTANAKMYQDMNNQLLKQVLGIPQASLQPLLTGASLLTPLPLTVLKNAADAQNLINKVNSKIQFPMGNLI